MVPGAADEGRGPRPFVGSFVLLCVCQLICTGVGAIRSFPYFRFASLWFLLVAADARTSSLSPVHPSLSFPGPLVAHPLHSPIPHTKHTPGWTPHMVHTHTPSNPTPRSQEVQFPVAVAKGGLVPLEEVRQLGDVHGVPFVDVRLRRVGRAGQVDGVAHLLALCLGER